MSDQNLRTSLKLDELLEFYSNSEIPNYYLIDSKDSKEFENIIKTIGSFTYTIEETEYESFQYLDRSVIIRGSFTDPIGEKLPYFLDYHSIDYDKHSGSYKVSLDLDDDYHLHINEENNEYNWPRIGGYYKYKRVGNPFIFEWMVMWLTEYLISNSYVGLSRFFQDRRDKIKKVCCLVEPLEKFYTF